MAGRRAQHCFRVIQFVARRGDDGATLTDIRRFIVEEIKKLDWDERDSLCPTCRMIVDRCRPVFDDEVYQMLREKCGHKKPRRYRGYWSDFLPKLLPRYCARGEDGRWRINSLVTSTAIVPLSTSPTGKNGNPPRILFRTRGRLKNERRRAT